MLERALDNYNITCTKKKWNPTLSLSAVNFFSGVAPQTEETIDIKNYLVDIGELSYDFDEAGKENGENQLFYVSSDINFKLSGIADNNKLKSFFSFFEDTDYIKWHIKIVKGFSTIWEGFVHHESIDITFSPNDESEIINLTALSLEKEFKEFYSNKSLAAQSSIFSLIGGVNAATKRIKGLSGIRYSNAIQDYNRLGRPFRDVLRIIFPGTLWSMSEGIEEWHVIDNPVLYPKTQTYGTSDNYIFVKSSWERIRTNGENCYDYLRRTCNAMGWVFYYQAGQFKIKNRSTDIATITTLDVDKILEYTVTKYKETTTFPHVLILDGTIDGGDGTGGNQGMIEGIDMRPYQMRGARFQLLSDNANPKRVRNGQWWLSINSTGYDLQQYVGTEMMRYYNEDSGVFNVAQHKCYGYGVIDESGISPWAIITYPLSIFWGLFGGNDYQGPLWSMEVNGIAQNDILRIDAGDTGTEMWLYDVTTGHNDAHSSDATSPHINNNWTEDRVRFKGNYGNQLVKLNKSLGYLRSGITET